MQKLHLAPAPGPLDHASRGVSMPFSVSPSGPLWKGAEPDHSPPPGLASALPGPHDAAEHMTRLPPSPFQNTVGPCALPTGHLGLDHPYPHQPAVQSEPTTVSRAQEPRGGQAGHIPGLARAGVCPMVPEDRAKCWSWAVGEGSAWEPRKPHAPWGRVLVQDPRGGHDHVDGQILGQLRTLAEEEEEEEGAGASSPPGAACPGMGSEELRLASFYDWPLTAGVRPEPLAAAGFFHTGQQDKVRCFFCYGGLQSWEHGDDPWTEHAKWFPRCQFLLRSKGRDFVHSIQESGSQLLSPWDLWEEPEDAAPASPSGPVHEAPELTPRTEPRLESAREPGAGAGAVAMEEQLRRLQEERTCKVCLDQAVSVVFVPCGHLVCTQCAPNLHLCPICRAPVHSCVRTFLS